MMEHEELLSVFVEESLQHLQTLEPDLISLEQSEKEVDPETVNRIFRGIHSIKGASGFFGFKNIGELSHAMEHALALIRDGKLEPTPKLIDVLFRGVDTLKAMLEEVQNSDQFDIHRETAYLKKAAQNAGVPDRKITVEEKKTPEKEAVQIKKFDIPEDEVRRFVEKNLNLYTIKVFLNKDFRDKGKSPFDFINQIEELGYYVDAFLDITRIHDLTDCLDNEIAFDFMFATIIKPGMLPDMLDVPEERIAEFDLEGYRKKFEEEKARQPEMVKAPAEEAFPEEETKQTQTDEYEPEETEEAEEDEKALSPSEKTDKSVYTEEKIRVGVNFLNDLVNLAGELVLGRNQLLQASQTLMKQTPGLTPVLQHISRVTTEMQEKIMQMRMQPISTLLVKFQRVVRTLARNHNKEVRLITYGEQVELDKSIIEGLSDPLNHLIRNSIDHGIEPPEERERMGKPRVGAIELRAYHQGGQVHLEFKDDGKGIDGKNIGRKALEKGLITRDRLNSMSEKELVKLIFLPGFSTTEEATDLSGRGVGMDVVQTNIEHLGGTVEIDTRINKGTRITMILPLTLAIISGLLVKAVDQLFILPEIDIDELVRVKPDEISEKLDIVQDAWVLRLRDRLLPLVNLNEALGLASPPSDGSNKSAFSDRTKPVRILVVKHGASRFGLIVDSIESTEEIVVKPLPRYLKRMKSFSGVSILGNGQVALIIDVAGIIKKAGLKIREISKEATEEEQALARDAEVQTLLVFDNQTPERFAFPLELISRIEQVPVSRIEKIKDRQFIQYHEKKLRLIFLEDYLPVSRPDRTQNETIGVIIPKQVKHPMGIVINEVINTVEAAVALDTETIMAKGLFGSAVLEEKITLLPDMYRLFEMAAPEHYDKTDSQLKKNNQKYRILLVDDTPFFRMVEKDYLTSAGYEVLMAEDGKQALRLLEEESVDAVVLDIVMPKMDGWEVIRQIRSDDRLKNLPVMAVTSLGAESGKDMSREGFRVGFDQWELKLNKTSLLEKLGAMLH